MTPAGRALLAFQAANPAAGLYVGPSMVLAIEAEARAAERERLLTFVRALISGATKPNGDRRDAHWLDEVVADLTPDVAP